MSPLTQKFSGRRLAERRLAAGMSQSELARKAQMREQQINRWERGKNVPSADAVAVLARALDVGLDDLFESSPDGDAEDDEEADLLDAAHALDRAGEYALADRLRGRAREVAREAARAAS